MTEDTALALFVLVFAGGVVGTLMGFTFYYNEKRMVVYWKDRYNLAIKDYFLAVERGTRERARIYEAWQASTKKKTSHPEAPPVPNELLGKMIRLCHPDRHKGSDAATEVTQWLLEQRK